MLTDSTTNFRFSRSLRLDCAHLLTLLRHERTAFLKMRLGFSWLVAILSLLLQKDLYPDVAEAANILGIFSYHLSSHFLVLRSFSRALVERGHNVTLITPAGMPPDIDGVRHIRIPKLNKRVQGELTSVVTSKRYIKNI